MLLAVIEAEESQPFNQRTLEIPLKVTQPKHANRLMTFLGLRSASGTLADDVLACRHEPSRLGALLRQRLQASLQRSGCSEEEVAWLGSDPLDPKTLKDRVRDLSVIRQCSNKTTRAGAVSCIATLHEIAVAGPSAASLGRRLGRQAATSVGPQTLQPRLRAPVVVTSQVYKKEYVLDFKDNKPVRVSVTFDRVLDSTYLERLGNLLIEEARSMSSSGGCEGSGFAMGDILQGRPELVEAVDPLDEGA
jgi:hypothetical protein